MPGVIENLHPDHLHKCYILKQMSEYVEFCVKITGWSRQQATHQLVHVCMGIPGVGSWFQEGMAVYVEKTVLGSRAAGDMQVDFKNGDFYHLADFIRIPSLLTDRGGHGHRNYAHAGAITEFMIQSKHEKRKKTQGLPVQASPLAPR